jgi:hypothetical protein
VRGFVGSGDRQYLTGLKVGGTHILLLVDVSASMLDETVVNVLRMRNMSETRKLMSDKWRRTLSTVDWIASQMPLESQFQLYAFNTKTWALQPNSDGKWLKTDDPNALSEGLQALHKLVPKDGTSMENAFVRDERAQSEAGQRDHHHRRPADAGRERAADRKTIDGDDRLQAVPARLREISAPGAVQRHPDADGRRSERAERVLGRGARHRRFVHEPVERLAVAAPIRIWHVD